MRVMVVGRGNVDPAATGQRSDDADNEKEERPRRFPCLALQVVLEKHEGKARPRSQRD